MVEMSQGRFAEASIMIFVDQQEFHNPRIGCVEAV